MRASVKKQLVLWCVWGFVVVGVPACASLLGLKDGEVPGDASVLDGAIADAVGERVDVDGGHVDPDASYAVCGDSGSSTETGYWVAPTGTTGQCTKASPCTLAFVLGTVKDGEVIHLANGNYPGQDIKPTAQNVRVEGGWSWGGGTNWTAVCDEKLANISSATRLAAVHAENLNGWTFALLTIENTRSTAGQGESNVALFTVNSQLTLENVRLATTDGVPGKDIIASGDDTVFGPCDAGTAGTGPAGTAGSPAKYTCDATGCHDVAIGQGGSDGTNGGNGAAGGPGGCSTNCKTCAPSTCVATSAPDVCAGAGKPGCGGARGFGGGGGATSGGSSIALYAWSSTITFTAGGTLKTGFGANGGAGGAPGAGKNGSPGSVGDPSLGLCYPAPTCSASASGSSSSCATFPGIPAPSPEGGSPGTQGGHGGPGGPGGGGAGGHSFCIFKGTGSSILNPPPNTEFHNGGVGGEAGGADGGAAVVWSPP